jgi:hypothetical protein
VATAKDPAALLIDKRFRLHERGLLSDDELGRGVVDDLAVYRAFGLVEDCIRRLPPPAAAEAKRYAREVAAPDWTIITWGLGSAPTQEQREQELAALKQVARQVLSALSDSPPEPPVASVHA